MVSRASGKGGGDIRVVPQNVHCLCSFHINWKFQPEFQMACEGIRSLTSLIAIL